MRRSNARGGVGGGEAKKAAAVEAEDYDAAKQIKGVIAKKKKKEAEAEAEAAVTSLSNGCVVLFRTEA